MIFFISCGSHENQTDNTIISIQPNETIQQGADFIVNDILDTLIADGFDYPVGDADGKGKYLSLLDGKEYGSWYTATEFAENYSLGIHTGIDLNGIGGGDTDLGQPVFSVSKGVVMDAQNYGSPWGKVVLIKHYYLENGQIQSCYSLYAHLQSLLINTGDFVQKRQQIGTIGTGEGSFFAHLHFEIRKDVMGEYETTYWPSSHGKDSFWVKQYYEDPHTFINNKRSLTCPYKEEKLIVAVKKKYTLYYYEKGILKNEYEIALSQNPIGPKQQEGDLKMPEGEYYIFGKQKGPFYGDYAAYLGNELLRISYPNIFDANKAYELERISKETRDKIIEANKKKMAPPQNTILGGGIVIHGWSGDWVANGGQDLTWGCISMHNRDLGKFYDLIPIKTKIIILP